MRGNSGSWPKDCVRPRTRFKKKNWCDYVRISRKLMAQVGFHKNLISNVSNQKESKTAQNPIFYRIFAFFMISRFSLKLKSSFHPWLWLLETFKILKNQICCNRSVCFSDTLFVYFQLQIIASFTTLIKFLINDHFDMFMTLFRFESLLVSPIRLFQQK